MQTKEGGVIRRSRKELLEYIRNEAKKYMHIERALCWTQVNYNKMDLYGCYSTILTYQ